MRAVFGERACAVTDGRRRRQRRRRRRRFSADRETHTLREDGGRKKNDVRAKRTISNYYYYYYYSESRARSNIAVAAAVGPARAVYDRRRLALPVACLRIDRWRNDDASRHHTAGAPRARGRRKVFFKKDLLLFSRSTNPFPRLRAADAYPRCVDPRPTRNPNKL